ncbi:MAG: AAA family ATPase [Betaproteobacteria bacterium]
MTAALANQADLQARLVRALCNPVAHGPAVHSVAVIETHISTVLLTGTYAYKIKKPVNLGFLDFSTLALRKRCCDDELRLNRRLAPDLYLGVVAIAGTPDAPVIGGAGPAIEHAVKMREFAQDGLLSRVLARGELTALQVDALAAQVAAFHGRVDVAAADGPYGSPAAILRYARQNLDQIGPLDPDPADLAALAALETWTRREHAERLDAFAARRSGGFIRECHGDLHLGNVALVDGGLTIFDCLEFNAELRWIDIASDVAFVAMDLTDRGRADFAHRFVNAWLEVTGDYAALPVLPFYLVYRALVRAKVACLRGAQLPTGPAKAALAAEFRGYLRLAQGYAAPARGAIAITHGPAGSGKTTLSQTLLEAVGAIRVRSDIERKRLAGLAATADSGSEIAGGLYTGEATARTYERLAELARAIAANGRIAIVDATFLARAQRNRFRALAADIGVPFVILSFAASEAALRERIVARARRGDDASEADLAVLARQLATQEPLAADELSSVVSYDGDAPFAAGGAARWRTVAARLAGDERAGAG